MHVGRAWLMGLLPASTPQMKRVCGDKVGTALNGETPWLRGTRLSRIQSRYRVLPVRWAGALQGEP